jgi:hypothetical protein
VSLLTIIQQACSRLAIPVPTAIVSSTDSQIVQLYSLANEEGETCCARYDWRKLIGEVLFSTLNQHEQTGALPSDFDHIVNESMWDRTTVRKVFGPLTDEQWQNEMAFPVYTPIAPAYIIYSELNLTPAPSLGDTLAFNYVKNTWARSASGTPQTSYTADSDTTIFGDVLSVKGVIWRFKKMKGLDYADEFQDYEDFINRMIARDGGKPRLNLAYGLNRRLLYPANIPIGNWPAS